MSNDIYEDLSDGEILDMIFDRFDIDHIKFPTDLQTN
jgi:hypothetical protein